MTTDFPKDDAFIRNGLMEERSSNCTQRHIRNGKASFYSREREKLMSELIFVGEGRVLCDRDGDIGVLIEG